MKKIILISIAFSLLFGCSNTKQIEVKTECLEKIPLEIQYPNKLDLKSVQWVIITKDNYKEIFDNIENSKQDVAIFGLTDIGYENLALNYAEVFKFVMVQKKIISSYKEYYENESK